MRLSSASVFPVYAQATHHDDAAGRSYHWEVAVATAQHSARSKLPAGAVIVSKAAAKRARAKLNLEKRKRTEEALTAIADSAKQAGRETLYKKDYALSVKMALAMNPTATDVELAEFLSISVGTLRNWQARFPEFAEACSQKNAANIKVVKSLYKKATGFTVKSEKVFYDGRAGNVVRADTTTYYPPDFNAASYWLNNRMPEHWRSRVEIETHGAKTQIAVFQTLQAEAVAPENALEAYNALLELGPADYKDVTDKENAGASAPRPDK